MKIDANSIEQYVNQLTPERKKVIETLRKLFKKNLPKGFKEELNYGMIGYVVPHTLYPNGYHCDPKLPLPFMNIASQKNNISIYHLGIYANPDLLQWFQTEYQKAGVGKLDMGKSCIRFKNIDKIPYELLGELASKLTVQQWIDLYEKNVKKAK
jgi:uncharacterized protein YdhG (YjbR/CyaY superfamily)